MKKKSTKAKDSLPAQVAKAKSILRGNKVKLRSNFSQIRKNIDRNHISSLVSEIYTQPYYQMRLFGVPFPKSFGAIRGNPPLFASSFSNEFLWSASVISENKDKLQRFVVLRESISNLVLQHRLGEAEEAVKALEHELGVSFWSTSLRMYLIHEVHGGASQQEYVKGLYNSPGIDGSSYYLAYYYSYRAKPSASLQQIKDAVHNTGTDNALGTYLNFKLLPFSTPSATSLATSLRYEASSSVIDLYDTFIKVIYTALLNADDQQISVVKEAALQVSSKINDKYLTSFTIAACGTSQTNINPGNEAAYEFLDKFITGGLRLDDSDLDTLILISIGRADVDLGSNTLPFLTKMKQNLKSIRLRQEDAEASYDFIERTCTNLSGFGWAHAIFYLAKRLWKGTGSLDLFGPTTGALYTTLQLPEIASMGQIQTETYLERLSDHKPKSLSVYQQYAIRSGPSAQNLADLDDSSDVYVLSKRLITAIKSSEDHDYLAAIEALEPIADFSESAVELFAASLAIKANIRTGQVEYAADLLARNYINNELNWTALPVVELAESLIASKKIDKKNLAIAIALDIYTKHLASGPVPSRSYAVEDFWEAYGVERPSELADNIEVSREYFLYYLRNLCVPSILEDSDAFQRSRELDEERIRVCQKLIAIDPQHAELYRDQIKTLTRRLVIYEGVKRIEQSKIYVDLAGIKSFLIDEISFDYSRLSVSIRDNVISTELSEINAKQMRVKSEEGSDNILLRFQRDSPGRIISTIMRRVWKEFARNGHYGLDVYLSTRIRHGTIVGHLRSPLEENHILCQRDSATGEYKDQPHWVDRFSPEHNPQLYELQKALKSFSERVDADLENLKSTKLRVKTEDDDQGWFNFVITERHIKAGYLYLIENPECSAADFLELCLQTLWVQLEKTLGLVRAEIIGPFRHEWSEKLSQLRQQVQALAVPGMRTELDTSIVRAATSFDIAIEKIAGWFTLSTSDRNPDFQLDLAVEIAAQSVLNCFGRSSIEVHVVTNDSPQLKGYALASFVDIFIIMFENVVRHSRVGTNLVRVDVNILYENGYYALTIRNHLPKSASISRMRERVHEIKSSLEDTSEDQQRLTREGGTGFHKLRKILISDLGCPHTFDFTVEEGKVFSVTLLFDAQQLSA